MKEKEVWEKEKEEKWIREEKILKRRGKEKTKLLVNHITNLLAH